MKLLEAQKWDQIADVLQRGAEEGGLGQMKMIIDGDMKA
jgi:hypothetical protein